MLKLSSLYFVKITQVKLSKCKCFFDVITQKQKKNTYIECTATLPGDAVSGICPNKHLLTAQSRKWRCVVRMREEGTRMDACANTERLSD